MMRCVFLLKLYWIVIENYKFKKNYDFNIVFFYTILISYNVFKIKILSFVRLIIIVYYSGYGCFEWYLYRCLFYMYFFCFFGYRLYILIEILIFWKICVLYYNYKV